MTREEAIQILSTRDAHGVLCGYTSGVTEAIDMAIEALQTDLVRCKDCRHLFADNGCPLRTWKTHTEDDFCSYGERKQP